MKLKTLFILLVLISCKTISKRENLLEGLTKISVDQIIQNSLNGKIPKEGQFKFVDIGGNEVTRNSMINTYGLENLGFDHYADSLNDVKIIVIRKGTKQDSIDLVKYLSAVNNGPVLIDTIVNCLLIKPILNEVRNADQKNRDYGFENLDPSIDLSNLSVVISILENCMPVDSLFRNDEIETIWLVLQHGNIKYAKKYFKFLENHIPYGHIDNRDLLMMKDRILIEDGKPQIYGTQICKNSETGEWELCKTYELHNINIRRAEVGFEPIEEYLSNWNIKLK